MLSQMKISFFLWLNNIPLCVYTFSFSIHQSMDTDLSPSFDYYGQCWRCRCHFEILISFPLDIHLGGGLLQLSHASSTFNFGVGTAQWFFFITAVKIYILATVYKNSLFSAT
jgi:hypothetical protein